MNKLIGILFSAFILFGCTSKKETAYSHNDLFFDNLKGPVEKTAEIRYTIDSISGIITPDACCQNSIEYDSNGYRTRQLSFDNNGNEQNGQTYTRFTNGLVKELTFTEKGKPISMLLSTLDKDGKYNTASNFDSSGKLDFFYAAIKVNGYGKIISFNKYSQDSTFQQSIINKYEKQNWIGGSIKDSSSREIFSTIATLNNKMDPVEKTETKFTNGKATINISRYTYTAYDEKGNWTEKKELNEKGKAIRIIKRQIEYYKKQPF